MTTFKDKISLAEFTIENLDISEIDELSNIIPKNGVVDLNIAEQGLVMTLHGQNICQEIIIKVDRFIGYKESEKDKAWTNAALEKSKVAGYKTAKDKEWFAQADDGYINACNELTLAKACKRWLENKANYFSLCHYAFKTFLKRDYDLERLGNNQVGAYNIPSEESLASRRLVDDEQADIGGDPEWE